MVQNNNRTGLEVAVIGMTGRFPAAKNIDEFWDNLKNGVESISFFPDQELEEAGIDPGFFKKDNYVKAKGVLADIEYFDYTFFDYTRKEAEWMDPQFRILHECCWHALEDAGYAPDTYDGAIGLYVGALANYQWVSGLVSHHDEPSEQIAIGSLNDRDFLSTRVAYKLNLKGPAITVQTACSTSLLAIHLGCQGLLSGESDMVLAGGVSLWLPGKSGYLYEEGMVRSTDGHCRAFDARANGTNGGDGAAVVLLKRLEDALAAGDRIHALVIGSAVNNDGRRKVGYTAPSIEGQVEVIGAALQMAEVDVESITYVEAHGTATSLGDPVEVEALKQVFQTDKRQFCAIGSVKTNVGHLDAAAGAAGFIKAVLALKNRLIPPSLHFETPNPCIDLKNSPFYVNTELREWNRGKYPLRAGVSSFGLGGTNAHVILEEFSEGTRGLAPLPDAQDTLIKSRKYQLILLSAKTQSALDKMTENLAEYFKKIFLNPGHHKNPIKPGPTLADAAYTLQVGRKAFKYRRCLVSNRVDDLINTLSAPGLQTFCSEGDQRPVVFMFSGQGSQYVNMGREIYETELLFREEMEHCFEILRPLMGYDIKEILYPHSDCRGGFPCPAQDCVGSPKQGDHRGSPLQSDQINQTEITQPVLFSFEYALAKLLITWGIEPQAMIGHSIGEYVAACLSGVFSLEAALEVVVWRGKLMGGLPGGAMLSVSLPEEQLKPLVAENHQLSLAAVNSPEHGVVSGPGPAIEQLEKRFNVEGYETRRLHTSHAFHSSIIEPILEAFKEKLKRVSWKEPEIPYISNVTGNWIKVEDAMAPGYWADHLRKTVRFAQGVKTLLELENPVFIEVGPGQALSTFARQQVVDPRHQVIHLIKHPKEKQPDYRYFLTQLGQLWLKGIQPGWKEFYSGEERCRVSLPGYPFEKHFFSVDVTKGLKMNPPAPLSGDTNIDSDKQLQISNHEGLAGEIEEKLLEIFHDVLGNDSMSGDDNFFQLGGDSLKAITAVSKINREFMVEFPLNEILSGVSVRELVQIIRQSQKMAYTDIHPIEKREYYPLSSAQKRLFFLAQLERIDTSYHISAAFKIKGNFAPERFEKAFKELLGRHEALRTSFHMLDNQPVQKIHDHVEFKIEYYDEDMEEVKVEEERYSILEGTRGLAPLFIKNFCRPFDLSGAPLLRVGLVKFPGHEQEYLLLSDLHHIIADGTSMAILVKEMITLYQDGSLPLLKIQYKDFSLGQRDLLVSGKISDQEQYWQDLYKDTREIPRLNLVTDYPRPDVFTFRGDRFEFKLGLEDTRLFKQLALENNVTLYMNLLAVLNVLLYKYTGQEDIIVGGIIVGRSHIELESMVGMFVNTLAIRNHPHPGMGYREFLNQVKVSTIKAFENQDVQFEELVDRLELERDPARNPLFDVCFVLHNFEQLRPELEGILIEPYQYYNSTSQFDLSMDVFEEGEEIVFRWEYYRDIFKKETMVRFSSHWRHLIREVSKAPGLRLSDLDILPAEEKQALLFYFNDTEVIYPGEKTLHGLFVRQVERTPDQTALIGQIPNPKSQIPNPAVRGVSQEASFGQINACGEMQLSYRELNKKSNQLAHFLYSHTNKQPEEPVGIFMENSITAVIAVLGVLKAGGGSVPLDPVLPVERIHTMVRDAGIGVVISLQHHRPILEGLQWECPSFHSFLCLDRYPIDQEIGPKLYDLTHQEKLWNYIGETAADEITGGGWISSYTGEPFTRAEMEEYSDNILKKLTPLLHKQARVLEIGCASGISMFRLAPRVGYYLGTDFSAAVIRKNKNRLKNKAYGNISLACLAAHEIDTLEEKDFDIVIINSVIQDFPDHQYLRLVIRKSLRMMKQGGYLFIGDVMDLELKQNLIAEMKAFKAANKDKNYKTKTDFSADFFVSHGFFKDLAAEIPGIREVEFSGKIYTIENELTKFRYDVLLTIDKSPGKLNPSRKKYKYQYDLRDLEQYGTGPVSLPRTGGDLAYIIYTSGSTGQPNGVMVQHRNVVNTIDWFTRKYQLGPGWQVLQMTNLSFDVSVEEIFTALTGGAALHAVGKEILMNKDKFLSYTRSRRINLVQFVPGTLKTFLGDVDRLESLRVVICGGDRLDEPLKNLILSKGYRLYNHYGPTEAAVDALACQCSDGVVVIGKPIANVQAYILLENSLQPVGVPGELGIVGVGVARGYLNNPELTSERFINYKLQNTNYKQITNYNVQNYKSNGINAFMHSCTHASMQYHSPSPQYPIPPLPHSPIYQTGDLARWLPGGNIEFLGRVDHQVKIRGYRIETSEIEKCLQGYPGLQDALVIKKENRQGEGYLCAYVVSASAGETFIAGIKQYLALEVPAYMVPGVFVLIEAFPRTSSGKIDRKALPDPEALTPANSEAVPCSELEKKLAAIWSEVLNVQKSLISMDADFFQLGGHSLKVIVLVAKMQQIFNVKVALEEVFKGPSLRELSRCIKNAPGYQSLSIQPGEEKEYYLLSSPQARIYIVNQLESANLSYNIPAVMILEGWIEKHELEEVFKKLIKRHESFRTSFAMIKEKSIQKIHKEVEFEIEYEEVEVEEERYSLLEGTGGLAPMSIDPAAALISAFIRPFDLSRAPLLRVGLIKLAPGKHIFMVDMHHIIADEISMVILTGDFMRLVQGEELPSLKVRYRDYSRWQRRFDLAETRKQENYWLKRFKGQVPVLKIPTDFPRPRQMGFEGANYRLTIGEALTREIKSLAAENEATLYMVMLAFFTLLLSKYSGQTDIIVGTPTAGRRHADLEKIVGMFINVLLMRNQVDPEKSFIQFLQEVKENALQAFENQDYPFDELLQKLDIQRDINQHPLYDVVFAFENMAKIDLAGCQLQLKPYPYEPKTAKTALRLAVEEVNETIGITLTYATALFRTAAAKEIVNNYVAVLEQVVRNRGIQLKDITIDYHLSKTRSCALREAGGDFGF